MYTRRVGVSPCLSLASNASGEGLFSCATISLTFSGVQIEIELKDKGDEGKPEYRIIRSKDPHKTHHSYDVNNRVIDYSDEKFLKDLELY